MPKGRETRVWATRDRTKAPPQRAYSRSMRARPTDAERLLWRYLRHHASLNGTHFRRQVQIGRYIADFASHAAKLVIEVDGGQHAEQTIADDRQTGLFEAHGYRVLRYWNNEVLTNIEGVMSDIQGALASTPTPNPSPQGGGEPRSAGGE